MLFGRIDRSQYDLPTPCADWNVGQVINHMISALTMFKEVAENGSADPGIFEKELIGDDAAKSLSTAGAAAVAGWSAPGKIDGTANLPFGEFPAYFALQLPAMDMVVHSWDLAKATGLAVDWDPELVADTRAFVEHMLANPEDRGHRLRTAGLSGGRGRRHVPAGGLPRADSLGSSSHPFGLCTSATTPPSVGCVRIRLDREGRPS